MNIGTALVVLAAIGGYVSFFSLSLGVEVYGASVSLLTNCGSLLHPTSPTTDEQVQICAGELGGQAVFAWTSGGIAAALLAIAIVIFARTPRRISF